MSLPLEDQFNDILAKAMHGSGKSPGQLSRESGLPLEKIRSLLGGTFDAEAVRSISGPLGLAADRLIALGEGRYSPKAVGCEGLRQFDTPFGEMMVNAYLVWDPLSKIAAIFDTGGDADGMLDAAGELGVAIEQVFITHSHGDHIFDLDRLIEKTHAQAWSSALEKVEGTTSFDPGREFAIGGLRVESRLTWGHSRGGITFVVHGLTSLVAICGDAMFAGSMGGGAVSYPQALQTNREGIFTLPDETILAPGHGPMTTVGEQRVVNPFFPDL